MENVTWGVSPAGKRELGCPFLEWVPQHGGWMGGDRFLTGSSKNIFELRISFTQNIATLWMQGHHFLFSLWSCFPAFLEVIIGTSHQV